MPSGATRGKRLPDPVNVSVALQMVLSLEGVEFQPARSQFPNVRK
jgi:hypothetical protein